MILVVDMNWKKDSLGYYEFVLPLVAIAEESDQTLIKHYLEVTEAEIGECTSVILSGTSLMDNVTLSQPEKFIWMKQTDKPILGICAGMQTIGVVFGLNVYRCVEIEMTQINTLQHNPLFSDGFKAYSLHNFSVQSDNSFEPIAESTVCIQAIRHKSKPIFGVLFHPEVRNQEIIKRFLRLKKETGNMHKAEEGNQTDELW